MALNVVSLPFDAISRILNRATTPPVSASPVYGESRNSPEPPASPPPRLAERIVNALNNADSGTLLPAGHKHLALPSLADFQALSAWCRAVGLGGDAEIIDAAWRR